MDRGRHGYAREASHRIAFEAQWSPQTFEETSRRQAQYAASGVRGLWLFSRPSGIQISKDVPSLLMDVDLDAVAAWVRLPAEESGRKVDHRARDSAYLWSQRIELARFVRGCLARKFVWAPGVGQTVPLDLWTAEQECWKCHKLTSIITQLNFRVDHLVSGARPISMGLDDFDNPSGKEVLADALKSADLAAFGIGAVRSRFSRTRGTAYLSNGCVHCGMLQGSFYDHEVCHSAERTLTIQCHLTEGLAAKETRLTCPLQPYQ